MKLAYVTLLFKNMFPMKNGLNNKNILYTGSHKSFPKHYGLWGGFLNCISAYLYLTKCNEINKFPSDVQKHVSYTGLSKIFVIYYELCLETSENVFSIVLHGY